MDAVSERHSPPSKFRAIRRRAVEDRMSIVDWLFFITIILGNSVLLLLEGRNRPKYLSRLRFYVAFTLAMAFVISKSGCAVACSWGGPFSASFIFFCPGRAGCPGRLTLFFKIIFCEWVISHALSIVAARPDFARHVIAPWP